MALRMMRSLNDSSPWMPMWYPPRPMAETFSPVRPSGRNGTSFFVSALQSCGVAATAAPAVSAIFTNSRRLTFGNPVLEISPGFFIGECLFPSPDFCNWKRHDAFERPFTRPEKESSVVADVGGQFAVRAGEHQVHVAALQKKQAARLKPHPKFKVTSKRTDAQPRMGVGIADHFGHAPDALPDLFLIGGGPLFQRADKRGPLVDVHSGMSLPALRSALIRSKSCRALRSTSSAVTPYSAKGLGTPMK